jgi:hypothetical protein
MEVDSNTTYEEEPVNRPQIDVKRKTYHILTWKKHLFLDIRPPTLINLSRRFSSTSKHAA